MSSSAVSLAGPNLLWVPFDDYWQQEICNLRLRTWKKEGTLKKHLCTKEGWIDRHDHHGRHLLCFRRGKLLGSLRYCMHDKFDDLPDRDNFYAASVREAPVPTASINRLVVDPEHQKGFVGWRLSDEVVRCISQQTDASEILFVGSKRTEGIAQKLGFEIIGEPVTNPYFQEGDISDVESQELRECYVWKKDLHRL